MNYITREQIAEVESKTADLISDFNLILSALPKLETIQETIAAKEQDLVERENNLVNKEQVLNQKQEVLEQQKENMSDKLNGILINQEKFNRQKAILDEEIKAFGAEKEKTKGEYFEIEKVLKIKQAAAKDLTDREAAVELTRQRNDEERKLIEREKIIDRERKSQLDMREATVLAKEERLQNILTH